MVGRLEVAPFCLPNFHLFNDISRNFPAQEYVSITASNQPWGDFQFTGANLTFRWKNPPGAARNQAAAASATRCLLGNYDELAAHIAVERVIVRWSGLTSQYSCTPKRP